MDSTTAQRLLDLNRRFYSDYGREFSATRGRLQTGVRRVLDSLHGHETILDLGCGNGELARSLSRRGQRGSYLGLDFSPPLLDEAGREAFRFPVKFRQVDLSSPDWPSVVAGPERSEWAALAPRSGREPAGAGRPGAGAEEPSQPTSKQGIASGAPHPRNDMFDIVLCFAVLHHIPSSELRLSIVQKIRELLNDDGRFIHSNWQFLNSEKLKGRIQAWDSIGLTAQDVDPNDYLLDWKRGGRGLRYVHHFDEAELAGLAGAGGFEIIETFYSDGGNKRLGLYQVWRKS
jgi:tRNA (uracil-5-)-methyltransferase TRM9